MFSKDKKSGTGGACMSVIGAECVITGDVAAGDGLRVDGRIEGNVRCQALEQGAGGTIAGDIHAESARLAGTVQGNVNVASLLLEAGARISGDVSYETLSVAPGARVEGRFAHRAALTSAVDSLAASTPAPKGPPELFAHAAE